MQKSEKYDIIDLKGLIKMEEFIEYLEVIPDNREQYKVLHKLVDIIVIVLFAKLANADDWQEIYQFAVVHEELLRQYVELKKWSAKP
ncbi:MAG TPA: transposase family protein [Clostridiales bacterium]|nr:transposase family protein [Clostridiales bacterium]